jgi:outer membrane protein TolC
MVLAEGRYDTGVGNVLEVADAVLAFNAAKVGLFQARHDYSAALAALERTLGGELE